jgi:hypothetical protein
MQTWLVLTSIVLAATSRPGQHYGVTVKLAAAGLGEPAALRQER